MGLISLFPSADYFVSVLSELFERSLIDPFNILPNPYYWAGNEPDIQFVWLFNWANRNDLAALYSRQVMNVSYLNTPDGLPGNDDYGTMSAWFVWTALGVYPRSGDNVYSFGSPVFPKVVINLDKDSLYFGNTLTLIANNSDPNQNIYIQSVTVNGKSWNSNFILHDQLFSQVANQSVTLLFQMGNAPKNWAN